MNFNIEDNKTKKVLSKLTIEALNLISELKYGIAYLLLDDREQRYVEADYKPLGQAFTKAFEELTEEL